MPPSSTEFLEALHAALPKKWDGVLRDESAGEWSAFMAARIQATGNQLALGMCSEMLRTATDEWSLAKRWQHGLRREYLFDVTLYGAKTWADLYPLPAVLIEHENAWSEDAFMRDFWKLMIGYPPLRVMFGYGRNKDQALGFMKRLKKEAAKSSWDFPPHTTDVVLLGHYGMEPREFMVFERSNGRTDWRQSELKDHAKSASAQP